MNPFVLKPRPGKASGKPSFEPQNTPNQPTLLLAMLMVCFIGGLAVYMSKDKPSPIIEEDGEKKLAPWRQEKLDKELEQLENAEVYVLLAREPGKFPCYHCPERNFEIFLNLGEVWRYGVTTQKEAGRYPMGLPVAGLTYRVLFIGPLQECLKQEKLYIYNYALLPENLKRNPPLIRPPGNKRDN